MSVYKQYSLMMDAIFSINHLEKTDSETIDSFKKRAIETMNKYFPKLGDKDFKVEGNTLGDTVSHRFNNIHAASEAQAEEMGCKCMEQGLKDQGCKVIDVSLADIEERGSLNINLETIYNALKAEDVDTISTMIKQEQRDGHTGQGVYENNHNLLLIETARDLWDSHNDDGTLRLTPDDANTLPFLVDRMDNKLLEAESSTEGMGE